MGFSSVTVVKTLLSFAAIRPPYCFWLPLVLTRWAPTSGHFCSNIDLYFRNQIEFYLICFFFNFLTFCRIFGCFPNIEKIVQFQKEHWHLSTHNQHLTTFSTVLNQREVDVAVGFERIDETCESFGFEYLFKMFSWLKN